MLNYISNDFFNEPIKYEREVDAVKENVANDTFSDISVPIHNLNDNHKYYGIKVTKRRD